jgi:hypothetical protein
VDTAEYDHRPFRPRQGADLISAKRVARMNPYPDHVAGLQAVNVEGFQSFVGDARRTV